MQLRPYLSIKWARLTILSSRFPFRHRFVILLLLISVANLDAQELSTPVGAPNTGTLPSDDQTGTDNSTVNPNSASVVAPPPPTAVSNNPAFIYNPTGSSSNFLLPQQ